jgi:Leucine-rich repeat (LRR) protein
MSQAPAAPPMRMKWIALAAVGLILLGGGWLFSQWRVARQLDAEAALFASKQGRLYFTDEITEDGDLIVPPPERGWFAYLFRSPLNLNLHKVQGVDECLKIAAAYPGLWQIDVSESDISDNDLSSMREMREMRHLLLNDTGIGDGIFETIAEMPNLETVDLSRTKITAKGLGNWRPPPSLKALMLIECDIGEGSLARLKNHPKLEVLRLCDTKANSACINELGTPPNLDELDLSGVEVDGDCVNALSDQKKLQTLRLADTKLSAEALLLLGQKSGRLRELDVSRLPLSDQALQRFCSIRSLKVLTLSGTPMTDEMAVHFFRTMQFLSEVAVDETNMTAGGIVRLAENTQINRLILSANLFSDKDRAYVKSLRKGVEVIEVPRATAPSPQVGQ